MGNSRWLVAAALVATATCSPLDIFGRRVAETVTVTSTVYDCKVIVTVTAHDCAGTSATSTVQSSLATTKPESSSQTWDSSSSHTTSSTLAAGGIVGGSRNNTSSTYYAPSYTTTSTLSTPSTDSSFAYSTPSGTTPGTVGKLSIHPSTDSTTLGTTSTYSTPSAYSTPIRTPSSIQTRATRTPQVSSTKMLTSLTTATPAPSSDAHTGNSIAPTETTKATNTVCNAWDLSSTDAVQTLIDDTGFVGWLDIMLDSFWQGETNWVNAMWNFEFPHQGSSPLTGCGNINSDCNIDTMCQDYKISEGYWVLRSVESLHSKINTISYMLTWNGWLAGLSIDQISSDFSQPKVDNTYFKWISAAFSMAAGLGTSLAWAAELRGMISIAAASMTMVSLNDAQTTGVDITNVEDYLASLVGVAGNYAAKIMTKAVGGDDDPSTLPIYTQTTLQHPTARFFSDNSILLDQNVDNSTFMNAYHNMGGWIEKSLVDRALQTALYFLYLDTVHDQAWCEQVNGGQWLTILDKQRCLFIMRPESTATCHGDFLKCNGDQWTVPGTTVKWPQKLPDTYNFNVTSYYLSLVDCSMYGNGTVDATTGVDGNARCFYNLPVHTGSWKTFIYQIPPVTIFSIGSPVSTTNY